MCALDTRNLVNQTTGFELSEIQKKQLKTVLLSMLQDIISFCHKHRIQYMLGGGSALGAVRHKGYIPWDDDLDLNMPREDYNRFIELFSKEEQAKYDLYVPDGIHIATHLFLKISLKGTTLHDIHSMAEKNPMGVSIDIFPIENVPQNSILRKLKGLFVTYAAYLFVSAKLYQTRNKEAKNLYSGSVKAKLIYKLRLMIGWCVSFKPYAYWYVLLDKWVQTKTKGQLCTIPTGRKHYLGEMLPWDVFIPCSEGIFENVKVFLPAKPQIYLNQLYGANYMSLPPENKREHHYYTQIDLGGYSL